jgi:S-adenosylmethionine hydrolase
MYAKTYICINQNKQQTMEIVREIKQEFEERELRFNGRDVFCWFTAIAKIRTEIDDQDQASSEFEYIDVISFEYAETLEEAGEGIYYQPCDKMVKALERDLEIVEFTNF